jgi:hypothetical protein
MSDESQDEQPADALYYPHVQFRSTAWVKSTLLFWETLLRFRPPGSTPEDDAEIEQLRSAGLIEEVDPTPFARELAPELGQWLQETLGEHPDFASCIPQLERPRGVSPESWDGVRDQLVADLDGYPAAREALSGHVGHATAIAMSFVPARWALCKGVAPVTDDPAMSAVMTYLQELGVSRAPGAPGQTLDGPGAIAQLLLPVPSLEAIAELPVDRLLAIRREHALQRRDFRRKVQAEVTAIAQLGTREAVEDRLRAFSQEIQDDLVAAREAVKDSKAKERWTFCGISAPASFAAGLSIAEAASPALGPVGGLGMLGLAVTSWFMRGRHGNPSPHYLLSIEKAAR